MKLTELFNAIEIENDSRPTDGSSAIFEGTKSYSQHVLNDMVEDHIPENTRVWKIQWVMSEDGNDSYRPQFIFARTKDEAAKKFTERMRHPSLGLVAIESIIEIPFNSINEGEVIQFPTKKKKADYSKAGLRKKITKNDMDDVFNYMKSAPDEPELTGTDSEKYDAAIRKQTIRKLPDSELDRLLKLQSVKNYPDIKIAAYATDIMNTFKKEFLQNDMPEVYNNPGEWWGEYLIDHYPYDRYARYRIDQLLKYHHDWDKVNAALKRKHGYDLDDYFGDDINEGDVINFPSAMERSYRDQKERRSDSEKYDTAAELQRLDREYEMRPDASKDFRMDTDPTKEEMQDVMMNLLSDPEIDEFNYEAAMYWFASDFHSGQSSNLYSVLSTSKYNPGPMVGKIEDEDDLAQELYFTMYDYFSNKVQEGKKLKKRKQPKDAAGAWNKAERYTKYDPPKTKNKGVSARRGFVGG